MKKLTNTLFIVFLTYLGAFSQNSLGLNVGLSSYEGDLHCFEEPDMNIINSAGLSFGLDVRKVLNNYLAGKVAYQFARFNGDDNMFADASGHPERNYSFTNNLHELTVRLDIEPWQQKLVSPYLSGGLGFAINNPNTFFDYENKSNALQSLINNDEESLSRVIFSIPVAAGLNFKVSDKVRIGTEFGWRLPMSDYLDGVSQAARSNYNDYFGTGVVTMHYAFGNSNIKPDASIKSTPEKMVLETELAEKEAAIEKAKLEAREKEQMLAEEKAKLRMENERLEAERIALEAEKAKFEEMRKDTDGDGFLDSEDDCPLVYSLVNKGCKPNSVTSDINCNAEFGQKTVNFQTSFSDLSNLDKEKLNYAISIMAGCPNVKLVVEGHTDSRGSEMVNQQLSEKRAKSVMAYIVSRGINPSRIRTFGYGENQPIASNETTAGRAMNRRVTISFQ